MSRPTNLVRGSIVKCLFPYVDRPHTQGPLPHYCLFIEAFRLAEQQVIAVCYGTSRLDAPLMARHQGFVLSVDNSLIKGSRPPGRVTHFVCSHVALLDEHWVYPNFTGRFDFMRHDSRKADPVRNRMFEQFLAMEPVMEREALNVLRHHQSTGRLGLPDGSTLR